MTPPIDDGRIKTARIEQGGNKCCGCGLSIGAGDRDAVLESHDLGQHLGATDQRKLAFAGRFELGIAGFDRRGIDHDHGVAEISGINVRAQPGCRGRAIASHLRFSTASEP